MAIYRIDVENWFEKSESWGVKLQCSTEEGKPKFGSSYREVREIEIALYNFTVLHFTKLSTAQHCNFSFSLTSIQPFTWNLALVLCLH